MLTLRVQMQCKWLGERVAAPSLRTVVRHAVTKESAPNWGPNATFRFPTHGGTGGIWTAVADMIPENSMRMGAKAVVERVDPVKKEVQFKNGKTVRYKHLVSTMALDGLLERMELPAERLDPMRDAARGLVFSSTIVLGVGVRGERPSRIGDKCAWPPSHYLETSCGSLKADLIIRLAVLPRGQHTVLPRDHLLQLL